MLAENMAKGLNSTTSCKLGLGPSVKTNICSQAADVKCPLSGWFEEVDSSAEAQPKG